MKKIEAAGIAVAVLLAPGYAALTAATGEPIEWGVVGFIVAMAIGLTLYATVLRKHTEDTQENRDKLAGIVKKVARRGVSHGGD